MSLTAFDIRMGFIANYVRQVNPELFAQASIAYKSKNQNGYPWTHDEVLAITYMYLHGIPPHTMSHLIPRTVPAIVAQLRWIRKTFDGNSPGGAVNEEGVFKQVYAKRGLAWVSLDEVQQRIQTYQRQLAKSLNEVTE